MSITKQKINNFIAWATDHRNSLFLWVCLLVHILYSGIFCLLGVEFLTLVNFLSTCFYAYFLLIRKDTSEKTMAISYFEILIFSILSNCTLGSDSGFFLYAVGMSASVFYLVPSYGNKRFVYQLLGIFTAFAAEGLVRITGLTFPDTQIRIAPYEAAFYLVNLVITSSIGLVATIFYSRRKDTVDRFMRYNMYHDPLTGLYNRRYVERQMQQTSVSSDTDFCICLLDIDYFKAVNDTYGHDVGDVVLSKLAEFLKEVAGTEHLAVRWGGEEFILCFPDSTLEYVQPIMENLRQRVEATVFEAGGHRIQITITVGISLGQAGTNYLDVIHAADEKLYYGKQHGRNQIVI